MGGSFRASMQWLHTWAGLVCGGILFAIFWMGTLSVFDQEIDRWMMPATRAAVGDAKPALESLRPLYRQAVDARSPHFSIDLPTERQPWAEVNWLDKGVRTVRYVDLSRGDVVSDVGTHGGTGFIYPFHYMLHIRAYDAGIWIVGLASMGMLALCVSGLVIHRKIFADFFVLRAGSRSRRLLLDVHNISGVVGIVFHLVITLSGLFVFYTIYFQANLTVAYGSRGAYFDDAFFRYTRPKAHRQADMASLDTMAGKVAEVWNGGTPFFIRVVNPGDAGSVVAMSRSYHDQITTFNGIAYFDGPSGALIRTDDDLRPIKRFQRAIIGLHLVRFDHWSLRWLYFALGLCGCVLIGTGFLFWLESRRTKHLQFGSGGERAVESLAVGSITGIVVATLAFFLVNRLLPMEATFAGRSRASIEIWVFYLAWLVSFAHGFLRGKRAWGEQCGVIAALAVAAAVSNWTTTGDGLVRTLTNRHLWAIAGMDVLLLATAAVAAWSASRFSSAGR